MHKDTNPKDAVAGSKPRWFSYLPVRVLTGVGLAMYEGARKYGAYNWRVAGVRASVYVDAAVCGHLQRWWEGEDIDQDSGLHHIDKAIASLMVLRDSIYEGNWTDDRPPAAKNLVKNTAEATIRWGEIQKMHPDPLDRNTHAQAAAPAKSVQPYSGPTTENPHKVPMIFPDVKIGGFYRDNFGREWRVTDVSCDTIGPNYPIRLERNGAPEHVSPEYFFANYTPIEEQTNG